MTETELCGRRRAFLSSIYHFGAVLANCSLRAPASDDNLVGQFELHTHLPTTAGEA